MATSRLNLQAGLTRLSFDLPPGSPPLRSRPRLRGTAAAGYEFLPGFTGAVGGTWVGRFHDSSIPTGPVQLGGYLLIDSSVSYRWHDARVTVAVDNVLDRGSQQLVGFPGRGRRWRLELSAAL